MKRLLKSLTRLFPRGFRDRFGEELLDQIEQDYDDARMRGLGAAAWTTLATAADLARSAAAERLRPTWSSHRTEWESGMRSTLNDWMTDLRYAGRSLRRSPGFAVITIGTLALAIGATAGMFSVVDTVLLNPLPYGSVDRLVAIRASAPGSDMPAEFGVSDEFFIQYKEQSKLLEDLSTTNSFTSTARLDDRVERIRMSWPTNSLFSTLGVKPILGRLPVAADEENAVVLSHRMWMSWFNGDRNVLGRTLQASGSTRTIVGVMGPEFRFPNEETMLWLSSELRADRITSPGQFGTTLIGRVKPGVSTQALASELTALSKALPRRFGGNATYAQTIEKHRAVVRTFRDETLGAVSRPLWVLLGAAGVVLLIACANVANLFLVRAEGRQRDLAVRRAIGAGRRNLIWSQMSESVVVACAAAIGAVALAGVSLPAFLRAAPTGIPRLGDVKLNAATAVFTVLLALVCALACGLIPALRASSPDLSRLGDGSRSVTRGRGWTRDVLVVGQTALALVLLIGSGLLVRSFWALKHVDPGYTTENIFSFQIAPEGPSLRTPEAFARFDLDFMRRLRALPGVESVGLVDNLPLNEGTSGSRFRAEGSGTSADAGPRVNFTFSAGDYFKAMGIKVLRGRTFDESDHTTTLGSVIVSKAAANLLWPGQDAIGKRVQMNGSDVWQTVVGVVNDVLQDDFRDAPQPLVYYPLVVAGRPNWAVSSPAYVVKTRRADVIAPEVRALAKAVAPTAPMYRVYTMEGLAKHSLARLSFTMLTLGIASSLALILGAVGLYGVLSYIVAQRTREIGVRMALGAEATRVRRMIVAQGARVIAIGVVIGIAVAFVSTRALSSLLFGVKALDATTFVGMSSSMILVGLLASYLPARRASRVDPIESLRGD